MRPMGANMGYYIDLKKISISKYKKILKTADLLPSWKILEKNIDKNLYIIKKQNIENLDELLKALKDKSKLKNFSKQSGLSENYLAVLKRVVNGYLPRPNRIKDFVCISEDTTLKLENLGIKNTFQLYKEILTEKNRDELSNKTGISRNEIIRLAKLTDLSRIRWVNHTFAYVLLEAGFDTAEKVANADFKNMYVTIKKLNKEKNLYKGNIGEHDMKLCVEAAQGLMFEIKY